MIVAIIPLKNVQGAAKSVSERAKFKRALSNSYRVAWQIDDVHLQCEVIDAIGSAVDATIQRMSRHTPPEHAIGVAP